MWNDFKSFISPTLRVCFIELLKKSSNHVILLLRNKQIANQTNSIHQLKVYNKNESKSFGRKRGG